MRSVAVLALLIATPTFAQTCPSPTGWDKPTKRLAARAPEMKYALATGASDLIELRGANDVKFAVNSGRKPKVGTSAGLAALDVAKAGKLDIILSNATFVDLVRDGIILKSSGHTDLKTCAGFRKSVSFDVVPGRYIVQLADAPERTVKMATVLN
ncbi:MAG: hypothetical protein ABI898_13165 [Sphingomonadales bacterium]